MSQWIPPTVMPPSPEPTPEPVRPPKPRDPVAPEEPPRTTIEAICCPNSDCRSVRVFKRWWRTGDAMATWWCQDCHTTWKERIDLGEARVAIP